MKELTILILCIMVIFIYMTYIRKSLYLSKVKSSINGNEYYVRELPDKQDAANDAMTTEGSIFTHDTHLEKLLTPVAEAFSKGANAPIIMDNSSNSSSVVKQGDTIQMPLGIHTTDPTAHAFHEWKYA